MTRIYSVDFRERVLQAHGGGTTTREIHDLLGVSRRSVFRWKAIVARGDDLAPKPKPGRPAVFAGDRLALLATQAAEHPDATLAEHVAIWEADHGERVGASTIGRALRSLGWVRKKESDRQRTGRRRACGLAAWSGRADDGPSDLS